jgi:hypothetical protein
MTGCGAARFLKAGGPVGVPMRACCAAALVHAAHDPARAEDPPPSSASAADHPAPPAEIRPTPFVCRATDTPALRPGAVGAVAQAVR